MNNITTTYLSSFQSTNGGGVTKSHVTTYLPPDPNNEQLFSMTLSKTHDINNLYNYITQRGFEIMEKVKGKEGTTIVILRKKEGCIPLNHPVQHM